MDPDLWWTDIYLSDETFDEMLSKLPPLARWVTTAKADEGLENFRLAGMTFMREKGNSDGL